MPMKKEKAEDLEQQFKASGAGRPTRTTIFLSESLNFFLDCYALESGKPKGEIVRTALSEFLAKQGYNDPCRIPNFIMNLKKPR